MTHHAGKRLLVTGASGFLGWNICRYAASRYSIMGIAYKHPTGLDNITEIHGDLTSEHFLDGLISRYTPDAVLHTAAAADPNYCQNHPDEAAAINITATVALARQCESSGVPFIFTSSSQVFDGTGTHPPYREEDQVNPLNSYGRQKVTAEHLCIKACSAAAICRMPLMYGDAPPHAKSFIQPMITALRGGRQLTLFTDEYRTPLSAYNAAEGIMLLLEKKCRGIFHLGGPQRLSRYDMGLLLADTMGISPHIKLSLQKDVPMPAPRAADVSLDYKKARSLGFVPGTMREELAKLACVRK